MVFMSYQRIHNQDAISTICRRGKETSKMRYLAIVALMLGSLTLQFGAQTQSPALSKNATCTFEDGNQISVRYESVPASNDLERGKPYLPGGSPMLLFSQTKMSAADLEIPAGAFSVYVIPESKKRWALAINRNVSAPNQYDPTQDLTRLPMDVGSVDAATKSLTVILVHAAPKQCNVRIYYDTTLASWAGFKEKGN
jgi:hypothetical protein